MFQKGDCIILPEIHPDASLRALRRCLCRSGLPQTTNCRARHSAGVRCGTRRCTCFRRCEGFRTGTRFRWYRSSGGCNSLRTIFAHTLPVIPCRLATTGMTSSPPDNKIARRLWRHAMPDGAESHPQHNHAHREVIRAPAPRPTNPRALQPVPDAFLSAPKSRRRVAASDLATSADSASRRSNVHDPSCSPCSCGHTGR